MSERLVVRVEVAEDDLHTPTVQDIFLQVLDLFDLVEEDGPVIWRLVSGRPIARSPSSPKPGARDAQMAGVQLDVIARDQRRRFEKNVGELAQGRVPRLGGRVGHAPSLRTVVERRREPRDAPGVQFRSTYRPSRQSSYARSGDSNSR